MRGATGMRSWTRVGIVSVALAALLAACSSSPSSSSSANQTTTSSQLSGHTLSLTSKDNLKTFNVAHPAVVHVSLPYTNSGTSIWQLASGGAGFKQVGPAKFQPSTVAGKQGVQSFTFHISGTHKIPIVLDYGPPGPLNGHPTLQYQVTINPT